MLVALLVASALGQFTIEAGTLPGRSSRLASSSYTIEVGELPQVAPEPDPGPRPEAIDPETLDLARKLKAARALRERRDRERLDEARARSDRFYKYEDPERFGRPAVAVPATNQNTYYYPVVPAYPSPAPNYYHQAQAPYSACGPAGCYPVTTPGRFRLFGRFR